MDASIDLAFESANQVLAATLQPVDTPPTDENKTDGTETVNNDETSSIAQEADKLPDVNTSATENPENTLIMKEKSKIVEKPKYTFEELFTPIKVNLDKKNELRN